MKKIRLKESELINIIHRVLNEQGKTINNTTTTKIGCRTPCAGGCCDGGPNPACVGGMCHWHRDSKPVPPSK